MCKTLQSTEEERTAKAWSGMLIPGTRRVMQHNPEVDFGKARSLCRSLVGCGSGSGSGSCGSRQVPERLLLAGNQVGPPARR